MTGLLGVVRRIRSGHSQRRNERDLQQRFTTFERRYRDIFIPNTIPGPRPERRVLVVAPKWPNLEGGLVLMKGLQQAGLAPVVLERKPQVFSPYYTLAGIDAICAEDEFPRLVPTLEWKARAAALLSQCHAVEEFVNLKWEGVRIGLFAASTASRLQRVGNFDLRSAEVRDQLTHHLARSMRAVLRAKAILDTLRPDLVTFLDTEYTPKGELFDICVNGGVEAIVIDGAHKTNALMLKRYNTGNRNEHVASLSAQTWENVRRLPWSNARAANVSAELSDGYATGGWYNTSRTQSHTHLVDPADAQQTLGLDPEKKTAFIFAHIVWDAPFSWATTLFTTYEEWLLETVRAACTNTRVNWVIKIHPAHVGKRVREGYPDEPAEVLVLAELFGPLPPHVTLMPADSEISTYSLFDVMDYCVTVRGTVGIEAATRGIPVLTAAKSRYSGRGFTVDSETQEEYLERLMRIQDLAALSERQRELAQRFAYGLFVLRPLQLESVTWDQDQTGGVPYPLADTSAKINLENATGWREAADLTAFASWIGRSRDEDFLACDSVANPSSCYEVQSA
jgi:hypothetical protein